ncbi:MAG: hypothetical protein MZW92_03660 [Comamonadaceae bacterium]|nr:hypothetical protein [Comamonadaceae bacterium]
MPEAARRALGWRLAALLWLGFHAALAAADLGVKTRCSASARMASSSMPSSRWS